MTSCDGDDDDVFRVDDVEYDIADFDGDVVVLFLCLDSFNLNS